MDGVEDRTSGLKNRGMDKDKNLWITGIEESQVKS